MNIPIIYIGFAQALFIALIIFLKRPLKISDVILGLWMITIAAMFTLNISKAVFEVTEQTWIYSLSISITFPSFLHLYSKYVISDENYFHKKDFLHTLPYFLTIFLIYSFRNPDSKGFYFDLQHYAQLTWLRDLIGAMFIMFLWVYGFLAMKNVIRYKKQIKDLYSYKSDRISLTWLLAVVISFMLVYNIIILASMLEEVLGISDLIDYIRDVALLIFVYIIGIWGYRQNQLMTNKKPLIAMNIPVEKDMSTGKYQKSGLKEMQAKSYIKKLVNFMDQTDAWKDNEFSLAKLSMQTNIAKHHITQVLNEMLGKNFYMFVNEYRIDHAKKLIRSNEYRKWSFVAIAYECGFNSKTAFNNFFKKNNGMTPSEYRESLMN